MAAEEQEIICWLVGGCASFLAADGGNKISTSKLPPQRSREPTSQLAVDFSAARPLVRQPAVCGNSGGGGN